ncbi:choline O-acetyltransferase-like isoform X1 [Cylas formicarius]|uniref:choline O-acetyltransferase-like isoform X1 n=1 Tax=Cylas formicarius TaxID=197179 RepID=UPI0029586A18|nr:choline O-acetyltransferase-like isoform X1 [Cylas formicarius]XP_060527167.1 choline O-acetyltransferase-like isoform X1 [Cylas formicarius]
MKKYSKTLQPLLDEKEYERIRRIIEKFAGAGGLGPKLQLYLMDRREKMDNWAYEYWLNDMYLNCRLPNPINSNPGMVFPPRKFTTILDVARFTARLIDAALNHKDILNLKALPVEKATSREPGQPLCMSQYYRILGCCRIPGRIRDAQYIAEFPKDGEQLSEHVIVMCRSQQYCVPVHAADRGRLTEDEICAQLLYILDDAPCLPDIKPVGLLTGWKRSLWAEAREDLMKEERNRRNLELITKSLLVVCLDEALTNNFNCRLQRGGKGFYAGSRDESNLAHQMIHGGGSQFNSANRWFDKTVQLIVSGDGACGLCYEHSMAEGVAVVQLLEGFWKHAESLPQSSDVPAACGSHLPPPERLEWILEASDMKRIEDAAQVLDDLIKDLDFQVYRYEGYGKNFMKSRKVSPDVYIQLALQLAYYKLYGKLAATYESASTRRFLLGRVDCIRSASPEALEWVKAMTQPRDEADDIGNKKVTFHLVSDDKKMLLWDDAVRQQTEEMVDNILGQGIDIHLLGLREAAKDTSPTAASPLPEIFTDPSYRLANRFLLSTSQVATGGNTFMGYGPVEPDGYGASYNPKNDHVIFCLSAFWSSEVTSTSKFAQSLEESLNAMHSLLSKRNEI